MGEWRTYKISQLIRDGVLEIGDGYRAKNSEMSNVGLPFIRAGDVNGGVNTKGCDLLGFDSVARVGNKRSCIGDIILTTKGTVGRLGFVSASTDEFVYSPQLCFWRSLNLDVIDPRFIYFALQSKELKHQIEWSAGQTDMAPYVSLTDQRTSFSISFPEIEKQRAIAALLGSLDDKIDLNRRMNETLEAMARAIFKDWFVDFGPVRAKAEGRPPYLAPDLWALFPDALDDDDKPVGWDVSTIGDEVKAVGGGTPSTTESVYWEDGSHHWVTPKDLSKLNFPVLLNTERKITDTGLSKISSGLLPVGTVLLSSRAPIGYLAIAEVPTAINQGFIAMVCDKKLPNLYVLFWCYENLDYIKGIAGGSTFAEITKKNFRPIPALIPSNKNLDAFDNLVRPLYRGIVDNMQQSQTLAQLRDLLLPKLMSGEIRLREVEQMVEQALMKASVYLETSVISYGDRDVE